MVSLQIDPFISITLLISSFQMSLLECCFWIVITKKNTLTDFRREKCTCMLESQIEANMMDRVLFWHIYWYWRRCIIILSNHSQVVWRSSTINYEIITGTEEKADLESRTQYISNCLWCRHFGGFHCDFGTGCRMELKSCIPGISILLTSCPINIFNYMLKLTIWIRFVMSSWRLVQQNKKNIYPHLFQCFRIRICFEWYTTCINQVVWSASCCHWGIILRWTWRPIHINRIWSS